MRGGDGDRRRITTHDVATEDDEDDLYVDIDIDPDSDTGTTEPPDTRPNLLERIGELTHSTNPFDGAFFQPNGTYVPLPSPILSGPVHAAKINLGNIVPNQSAILEHSSLPAENKENYAEALVPGAHPSSHQSYSSIARSLPVQARTDLPTPPHSGSFSNSWVGFSLGFADNSNPDQSVFHHPQLANCTISRPATSLSTPQS